ncbi:MAG: hypothetical protein IT221_14680 [Fluviicola sp.]|nr:hypothetical protein [Fluviicola sp.]
MNMDMQSLVEELNALVSKIKNGSASLGELEAFAAAAAQLNERAIVLKYKAYEAKVYGEAPVKQHEVVDPIANDDEVIPMKTAFVVEAEESSEIASSTEESMAFDLFSLDDEDEVEEVINETPQIEVETIAEVVTNDPIEADMPAFEMNTETVEMEEPAFEQSVHEIHETPVFAPGPEDALSNSHHDHPIYKRLVTDDESLATRLLSVRLESLKSAFGFNERLQIIQELFDGKNEAFNEALDVLDAQPNKSHARSVVSGLAYQFKWETESDVALDFVQKVERRYA